MISKITKTLLITVGIVVLTVYLAGCATTERKAKIEEPSKETLRRAFEGAPPLIPHDVEAEETCLDCHRLGENDAVITSHPERSNCVQCHIPEVTGVKPFVENTF